CDAGKRNRRPLVQLGLLGRGVRVFARAGAGAGAGCALVNSCAWPKTSKHCCSLPSASRPRAWRRRDCSLALCALLSRLCGESGGARMVSLPDVTCGAPGRPAGVIVGGGGTVISLFGGGGI